MKLLRRHIKKLIPMLGSLSSFDESPYASIIEFGEKGTLRDVRTAIQSISSAAGKDNLFTQAVKMSESVQLSQEQLNGGGAILAGLRSAAPLALASKFALPQNFQHYWNGGVVMAPEKDAKVPNPMLTGVLSEWDHLHYDSDPILGFHLATAFADLRDNSPLKPDEVEDDKYKVAAAAKVQFSAWIQAIRNLKHCIHIRFVVSDAFALCHTLQNADATGEVSANWYRRPWDSRVLRLDNYLYGQEGNAPTKFDAIDTSNLSDDFEVLNILVSASPLLKPRPWATLFTEQLIESRKAGQDPLDQLLYGPSSTICLLLGLTPLQYWTNAKVESHADEVLISILDESPGSPQPAQFRTRLAWKRDDQFGGYDAGRPKLHMTAKDVAETLFQLYLKMFENERENKSKLSVVGKSPQVFPRFHRGSFTALVRIIKGHVATDWDAVFTQFFDSIGKDESLALAVNQSQDFHLQLSLSKLHNGEWMPRASMKPSKGPLSGWKYLPPMVAITLVVPRNTLNVLFPQSRPSSPVPTLLGTLKPGHLALTNWLSMFDDVHIVFGRVTTTGDMSTGEGVVKIQEDWQGWSGRSAWIASFLVPSAALREEPELSLVGLGIGTATPGSIFFTQILRSSYTVGETNLTNPTMVYISKLLPGTSSHKVTGGGVRSLKDEIPKTGSEGPVKLMAEISSDKKRIESLTAHVQISSEDGKRLLQEKVPIELQQSDPFTINVVFGKKQLICPLKYPTPVTSVGSKTRIARTSGYIEVTAPLAVPKESEILGDFLSPTVLTPQGLPVAANFSHINLDSLPVVDLSEKQRLKWVSTLTSFQFSAEERRLRGEVDKSGLSENVRVNFKESLFTMFLVASGVQGGKTGMFLMSQPGGKGIQTLLFVSALRLDGDTASVVLDAAIIPLTLKMLESEALREFFVEMRPLEGCTLTVNDEELALWKKTVPSLVERCRTWNHLSTCEYAKSGATVPLSLEHGQKWLCSCGNGKIPDNFVSVPLWENVVEHAVRIAISPMYSDPYVEAVISADALAQPDLLDVKTCGNCGKAESVEGPKLRACSGCLQTQYCSPDCQKEDWKKHRMECKYAQESNSTAV
ncbi:mynd finger family [Trichoderma arundinaceum]|uniref:Mynd finger family n=1 Tax=Trichoderma arundinaceum TaxID=490622 RepID=A0A395NXD0_TRIAR|nr:mynd finger family [Trichoderma arundinaceum]